MTTTHPLSRSLTFSPYHYHTLSRCAPNARRTQGTRRGFLLAGPEVGVAHARECARAPRMRAALPGTARAGAAARPRTSNGSSAMAAARSQSLAPPRPTLASRGHAPPAGCSSCASRPPSLYRKKRRTECRIGQETNAATGKNSGSCSSSCQLLNYFCRWRYRLYLLFASAAQKRSTWPSASSSETMKTVNGDDCPP